jgi:hypothetical protein
MMRNSHLNRNYYQASFFNYLLSSLRHYDSAAVPVVSRLLYRLYWLLMFMPRSTLKRSLALFLPICFVWIFVACVMICTAHAAEVQNEHAVCSSPETELLPKADCCPISGSQMSVLPERRAPHPKVSGDHVALFAPSVGLAFQRLRAHNRVLAVPSFPDPPLARSCVLLI